MFHLFVLFSLTEYMVDLFIEMKFAETSFDQDSIKICMECYLRVDSFVCSIFSKGMYVGPVH
jgi:hypothetical protein